MEPEDRFLKTETPSGTPIAAPKDGDGRSRILERILRVLRKKAEKGAAA